MRRKRREWKHKGLHLLFLPPYSPHLNRIETLWRQVSTTKFIACSKTWPDCARISMSYAASAEIRFPQEPFFQQTAGVEVVSEWLLLQAVTRCGRLQVARANGLPRFRENGRRRQAARMLP